MIVLYISLLRESEFLASATELYRLHMDTNGREHHYTQVSRGYLPPSPQSWIKLRSLFSWRINYP